jgi:hypothetical protein
LSGISFLAAAKVKNWLVAEWVVVKVEPWGVRKVVSMVDS